MASVLDGTQNRPHPGERAKPWSLTLSQVWIAVAIALPMVALLLPPLSAIDLAYQVRVGEVMLRTHDLVRTDFLSFTAAGTPWVNQQWGAEVLLAWIARAGGWAALILSRAALGGVIAAFVYLSCRASGAGRKLAAGLTVGGVALAFPGFILRPQILGLALFAAAVWIVASRVSHPARLWVLPVLTVVWANVHGSFFLAPLLLGLAYLEDRLAGRTTAAKRSVIVGVVTVAAALINPYGARVWQYVLTIAGNREITDTIVEWRPPTVRTPVGLLFFVSVLAVAVVLWRIPRPVPPGPLVTLGVFFFMGLFAGRGVYWWGLVAPAVLVPLVRSHVKSSEGEQGDLVLNGAIVAMLLLLGLAFLPWWRGSSRALDSSLLSDAPPGVTAAAARVLRPGDRMFNPQIWGSWFEFALPDHPVFVDSRIEVFSDAVWRDYEAVSGARDGWQEILDRWSIDVVVADRRQQSELIPVISKDPGWVLVHRDAEGAIFVRGG
jgi:hypothetical protein